MNIICMTVYKDSDSKVGTGRAMMGLGKHTNFHIWWDVTHIIILHKCIILKQNLVLLMRRNNQRYRGIFETSSILDEMPRIIRINYARVYIGPCCPIE